MRTSVFLGACAVVAVAAGVTATSSCTTTTLTGGVGGAVGAGGHGGQGGDRSEVAAPGEICSDPTNSANLLKAQIQPTAIYVPTCQAGATCTQRTVKLTIDPDTCTESPVRFIADSGITVGNGEQAATCQKASECGAGETCTLCGTCAKTCAQHWDCGAGSRCVVGTCTATWVALHHDEVELTVSGGAAAGAKNVTACIEVQPDSGTTGKPVPVTAKLTVQVLDPKVPVCSGTASGAVKADAVPLTLGAASVALQVGADMPDTNSFLWSVSAFDADIACGADSALEGYIALGPAITFSDASAGPGRTFPREIPLSVPINPALMPGPARLRHVQLAYSGPAFMKPRTVPVADVHVTQVNGQWALGFMAPRLGTYQAVVAAGAGSTSVKRRLTHRGVMGVSMGGGGTATFGMRHHDLFDVLAPLGGPVDWTWMLKFIETNNLGGFRPIPSGTTLKDIQLASATCTTNADCKSDETCIGQMGNPPGKCILMPKADNPYEHPETFNTWWYEYPRAGNGGTFARSDYIQIFRDLALMYGNPNGDNNSVNGENLPPGVPPNDPTVVGNHPNRECAVWVDPLDCPDGTSNCASAMMEQEIANDCPTERCSHTLTLQNYFDGAYNPDGIFPVITVCDGSPQDQTLTPYSNTWGPTGDGAPLELALAVDYNGNGVRDELEPIIRSGHEPWRDVGEDGIPSSQEPGYMPGVNDDPNGDDYNPQYNPTGTEGDFRYQMGEPFDDWGLDGVPNTKQQPATGWAQPGDGYDVGEGDGKFTVSRGIQRFWDRDAHSIVRQMVDPANVPGGILDDGALSRIDVWADGGMRDLFNFGVDAQHLVGAFAARGRDVTYLTSFTRAPGLDPTQPPDDYNGKAVDFDDLPGIVLQRYGEIDPSPTDINDGSGQHVGTASEVVARLEAALYFMTSRWKDHPELRLQVDANGTAVPGCTEGSATISFPAANAPLGPSGRRGPVGVSLPPGYCNADLQNIRYPVIYLLHGYGQTPQDLEPTIVLLANFMNDPSLSQAHRLTKAIIVYVDGRCRLDADGVTAECIRGTFFADSVRPSGAQDETWWLELMTYMDQNYRTLGESTVDWTE